MEKRAFNRQLVIAACFARTNMGQEAPTAQELETFLKVETALTLSEVVGDLCGRFMETDEHEEIFYGEAESWLTRLQEAPNEWTFLSPHQTHIDLMIAADALVAGPRGHGSPYDCGNADAYYGRHTRPHRRVRTIPGSDNKSVDVILIDPADIAEYDAGFEECPSKKGLA